MKALLAVLALAVLLGALALTAGTPIPSYGPDPGPEEDRTSAVAIAEGG